MSGLRGRSAVAADHRSALPQIPGIPWWGAAIVATAVAALGFAFSAGGGNEALGGVFATFYVIGCVLAVLAVRQSGVFTAVIQPPLILFVIVPFAYFVFHGSTFTGIKDTLINCGYPLIERFPLMFYTSAVVLVIGMVRWFVGAAARRAVPTDDEPAVDAVADEIPAAKTTTAQRSRRTTEERPGRAAATAAATAGASAASAAASDEPARPPRRSTRTPAGSRSASAESGADSRRSRHAFPPDDENVDDVVGRPRRRSAPPVDPTAEPRRRPRSSEPREPRDRREPRERRPLPPVDRRGSYERPERAERPQRRERPDSYERERPERSERPQRRPRVSNDYESHEPPPTIRTNGSGTHHPVSRVRYRNTDDGESRTEHRTRPRPSRHSAPESWEYDV